jgi:hypothetical protein
MALFAAGASVDAIVSSGVHNHLEFLAAEHLSVVTDTGTQPLGEQAVQAGSGGGGGEEGSGGGRFGVPWAVPCSKKDIFGSSALGVLEKNRLMKLLRACLDWGHAAVAAKDMAAQSDKDLATGRSLKRPQNAAAASTASLGPLDPAPFADAGRPFADLLAAWKLPARLADAVTFAIALLLDEPGGQAQATPSEAHATRAVAGAGAACGPVPSMASEPLPLVSCPLVSSRAGLEALYRHLSALGQYGDTAFLLPQYGSGDVRKPASKH